MKYSINKLTYVISFFIFLFVVKVFSQDEPITRLFDIRAIYYTAPRISEITKNGDTTFYPLKFNATNIEGNKVYLIYEYLNPGPISRFSVDTLNLDLVGGFSLDTTTSYWSSDYIKPIFKDDKLFISRSPNEFNIFGYKKKEKKWTPLPYYNYSIRTMENVEDYFYVGMMAHYTKNESIIRKYDANLTLINTFTYKHNIIDIVKSDDNNLMVLTKKEDGKNYIQKIDSGGVVLNDFLLSDTNTLNKIYSVRNNKFVISGYTADSYSTFLLIDGSGNEIIKKKDTNWYKFNSLSVFDGKYYLTGRTRNKIVAYLEFNPENSIFKTYYNSFNILGTSYESDMDDYGNLYISNFNSVRSINVLKVNLPQPLFLNSVENDLSNENIIISPNPATDYITITLDRWSPPSRWTPSDIEIYDVMGVKIQTELIHPMTSSHRMNVGDIAPGVYFVKIVGNNGACSIVEKFVKY